LKTVIFTRTGFQHTSFINRLLERFEIACVVREAYPDQPKKNGVLPAFKGLFKENSRNLMRDAHFLKKFTEICSTGYRYNPMLQEHLWPHFDVAVGKPGTKYLNIRCGEINSPELREFLNSINPDIIAVLGSSVIRPELISLPSVAMINIHSGLSPYYRGTWSYGWPIINREPEYIGVTVHHVNEGIDTGDIIYQTKPLLKRDDDLNSIFLKVIAEGIELMVKAIEVISDRGSVTSHKQSRDTGRLYQLKDFDAGTARAAIKNLEDGLIGEYLSGKEERDLQVKLFGYVPPVIFR